MWRDYGVQDKSYKPRRVEPLMYLIFIEKETYMSRHTFKGASFLLTDSNSLQNTERKLQLHISTSICQTCSGLESTFPQLDLNNDQPVASVLILAGIPVTSTRHLVHRSVSPSFPIFCSFFGWLLLHSSSSFISKRLV